jgi:type I restriction enzyme S subunit
MTGEETVQLRDVCVKIGSGATPRGGKEAYKGGATSLIRSQNIYNEGFHRDGLVYIDDDQSAELRNVEVKPNDVLLNITGDSVARCCQVAPDVLPARVNQHVAIIRPQPKSLDARFLRYVLVSHKFQSRLLALASAGATRPALTKSMIEELAVPSPPLAEQKAIAAVLGALDDKIELIRRMNATLEAMARALFQSWFVDFDPVRAKLDGRKPIGMDATAAALFPEHLEDSKLGHIPKGWRACTLGDIAKNVSITFDFNRTPEVVFINTGDVLEGDFLHSKRSLHAGLPGQAKKSIRPDDILFSEIRPANKRYAYVDFDSNDYVVSTKFMIIRGSKEIHPRLLYRILTAKETLDEFQVQAESRSGTFPQITFDSISHLPIVLPPIEIQEAFQRAVGKMDAQIKVNKQQSRTLATLRDTLLPKLLSGELSVEGATKATEVLQ